MKKKINKYKICSLTMSSKKYYGKNKILHIFLSPLIMLPHLLVPTETAVIEFTGGFLVGYQTFPPLPCPLNSLILMRIHVTEFLHPVACMTTNIARKSQQ